MTKCEICHNHEAEYAVLPVGEKERPFYFLDGGLGQGLPVTRVCLDCYWDVAKRKE